MLDNLRDDANTPSYYEDDELPDFFEEEEKEVIKKPQSDSPSFLKPILDLSPVQRFIITLLIFMAVCLIGSMFLLVFGRFSIF